jgi:peptide deformylase
MSVREIVAVGAPVLRAPARELGLDELRTAEVQGLIDDLIETRRAANGAGLAAVQIGAPLRIAVAENEGANPRYPYKPPIPLTVMVNPALEPLDSETFEVNEGCLSVPDLRGNLTRHVNVRVRYLDRDGNERDEVVRGLTAGTFQHEIDHLNGTLFVYRADPRSLATWEQFERHQRDEFVERATELVRRVGS